MNKRLFWLALGTFAIGAEGFVISSLLPQIAHDTDVGLVAAGYLVVAFALTYAIGAPILTALTGTRDRRIVLAVSALVFAAGALGASLSHGYAVLLASRMVIACAAGLYAATAQATAVAISPKDHRARAISVIVGGTSLAVAFGAPLGAFIASVAGWRGTYVAIAAAGFLAAGAIWVMVPSGLRGEKLPLRARLTILAQPSIAPALATTLLYMTGGFAVLTYIAPMAIQAAGFSPAMLPAIFDLRRRRGDRELRRGPSRGPLGRPARRDGGPHSQHRHAGPVLAADASAGCLDRPVVSRHAAALGYHVVVVSTRQASRMLAIAPASAPLALSLNGSALYLGVALGSFIGGLVLQLGSIGDLGWVAALFPASALLLVCSRRTAKLRAEPICGVAG